MSRSRRRRVGEAVGIGADAGQSVARCSVQVRISSTGTIPGTMSLGILNPGRPMVDLQQQEADTARCYPDLTCLQEQSTGLLQIASRATHPAGDGWMAPH
jgi:hypothetical protein